MSSKAGKSTFLWRYATPIAAALLVAAGYWFTSESALPDAARQDAAARFKFSELPLYEWEDVEYKNVRQVHPSFSRLSAMVSALGAAVALHDLDGDGLANDVCHVDPRTDRVTLSPVPGTGNRYVPFFLDAGNLPMDATMAPMGCLPGDMNEDGQPDLLVYYWGRTPVVFLRRPGTNLDASSFVAREIMPGRERWYSNSAAFADLDGDGHLDLVIGNTSQDGAHILDAHGTGVEVLPESRSRAFNGGWNHILVWSGASSGEAPSVVFGEAKGLLAEDVARGWTLALGMADLDGDLLPEIYFANDYGPDRLLHNRSRPGQLSFALAEGTKDFITPASFVLGRDSFKGMGIDYVDMNGDGWLDMYVSNIAAPYAFQESHLLWVSTGEPEKLRQGIAPYRQESERHGLSRSGWAWDARLADFDNDGAVEVVQATGFIKGKVNRWPEMQALGTVNDTLVNDPRNWPRFKPGDDLSGHEPNCFFVRDKNGRYHDIARDIGLGKPVVSRGIAIADVDGDGDLDMALANQYETSVFYRNDSPRAGNFLGLNLLLPATGQNSILAVRKGRVVMQGRPAIGAQATVILPNGQRKVAQVDGGSGHSGKRAPELHFGLGRLGDESLKVELRWRGAGGVLQSTTLKLSPGWHTILLGPEKIQS